MAATPPKGIYWTSRLTSPASPSGSTDSYIASSSLEYVNSQLVAHGFASSPGLSLDGLSGTDSDRVVKCLLGMLGQRVEDMSRTEQLSTKLRTLTYDHERLLTMERTAKEKAANAEKEVSLFKTRLTAIQRTLQSAEAAHKQTSAELQRTRTSMQSLRATHQAELRKKELDFARMSERWSKISDSQAKLSSVPAGLCCTNLSALEGSSFNPQTDLEATLEETEKARTQLIDETMRLRRLVVKIVNQVQALLHQIRGFTSPKEEELPVWSLTNLFPMHPPTFAHDTLSTILISLRDTLAALPEHIVSSPSTSTKMALSEQGEITRLQEKITQLREELAQSHKQSRIQAAEARAMLDKFTLDQQKASEMVVPMIDEERERLEEARRELDEERERLSRDTIKLDRERATLEAERNDLLNEKRSWKTQQMLEDPSPSSNPLPPQPQQPPAQPPRTRKQSRKASQTQARTLVHSPSKKSPKRPRRSTTRVPRRPSTTIPLEPEVIPPVETEIIPPQALLPPPPPPLAAPSFPTFKPTTSILPSFVLPPPSPHASLPSKPILPPQSISPPNHFEGNDSLDMHVPPEEADSVIITPDEDNHFANPDLLTPMRRPFPMAKPLASHMIHAYSPVKPSPLSRILMLSHSPNTPLEGMTAIPEGDIEEMGQYDDNGIGMGIGGSGGGGDDENMMITETPEPPRMSLAAELGVESPPDEDIGMLAHQRLKRKRAENDSGGDGGRKKVSPSTSAKSGGVAAGKKKTTLKTGGSKEKSGTVPGGGGGRRTLRSGSSSGGGGGGGIEKENGKKKNVAGTVGNSNNVKKAVTGTKKPTMRSSTVSSRSRTTTAAKGVSGPGPRRVPLDSEDAPQIPKRKS